MTNGQEPEPAPGEESFEQPRAEGSVLGGRYRIGRILGRGGMAVVYHATDLSLQREVAVKVLHGTHLLDEERVQRFLREAHVMAAVDSPHVVPIYDVGRDDASVFLVTKLLDGRSLAEVINDYGFMSPERASRLVVQVLDGLDHLHTIGLVHRDVKPSNIMVLDGDRAILLDLGIARDASGPGLTTEGTAVGTPEYMAPEQVLGRPIDARTDLYATGVVLFEILTRRVPFAGASAFETCRGHVSDVPPSPRQLRPEIGEKLERVILKALEKHPALRFQTAREMRDAIEAATRSLAVTVAGAAPVEDLEEITTLPDIATLARQQGSTLRQPVPPFRGAEEIALGAGSPVAARHRSAWIALGIVAALVGTAVLLARPGEEAPASAADLGDAPHSPPALVPPSTVAPETSAASPPTAPSAEPRAVAPTSAALEPATSPPAATAVTPSSAALEPATSPPAATAVAAPRSAVAPRPAVPRPVRARIGSATPPPPSSSAPHAVADGPVAQARARLATGDTPGAIKILQAAVGAHPERAELYAPLGDAYLKTGNRVAAIAAYRRHLALSPQSPEAPRVRRKLTELGGM